MVVVGGDFDKINFEIFVDFVIDYFVQVDKVGIEDVLVINMDLEFERNVECYKFLSWVKKVFNNYQVVLFVIGIVYQVNLEFLVSVVYVIEEDGEFVMYFDMFVGIDLYIIMINGIGVFGWGVGGIEVEVGMFGQFFYFLVFEVIGVKFVGKFLNGIIVIDLVLKVIQVLCEKGVVGKFVEFFGLGVVELLFVDCVIIVNMVLEYGVICGFFLVDEEVLNYLCLIGCDFEYIDVVEVYCRSNGLFYILDVEDF